MSKKQLPRRLVFLRRSLTILAILVVTFLLAGFLHRWWIARQIAAASATLQSLGYPTNPAQLEQQHDAADAGPSAWSLYQDAFAHFHFAGEREIPIFGEIALPVSGQPIAPALAEKIASFIAANAEALAILRRATAEDQSGIPLFKTWVSSESSQGFDDAKNMREAARLLALDAVDASVRNDTSRQIDDVTAGLRLGGHVRQRPDTFAALVAVAVDGIALLQAERMLSAPNITASDLDRLRVTIVVPDFAVTTRRALGAELAVLSSGLDGQETYTEIGGTLITTLFHEDEESAGALTEELPFLSASLGWLAMYSGYVDRGQLALFQHALRRAKHCQGNFSEIITNPVPQIDGDPWNEVGFGVTSEIANVLARSYTNMQLLRIGCTLRKQQLALGHFPANLNELGKEEGTDIFAQAPYHCIVEGDGVRIYSVGINRKDDGGTDDKKDVIVTLY